MEDEAFYVIEGQFLFPYGSKQTEVSIGQFMYVPRVEFHTYKNWQLFWEITGSHYTTASEKFFEEIGMPVDDKSSFKPPKITPAVVENVVKTATRYGLEIKT